MPPVASTLDPQTQADIDFVVREFSNHVRRDEIKQSMMARRSLSWSEAEEFVSYVESNYRRSIVARQTPLFLFLAVGSLIVGCALLAYVVFQLHQYGIPASRLATRRLIGEGITGAVLLLSGFVGLIQTIAALRE